MKAYKIFDTGEIWTEKELREVYELFKDEMENEQGSFEEYLEHLLDLGKNRIGGLVEV